MANYTKITNFTAKDSLPSGNAAKKILGSLFDTEFNNISTAIASKANLAAPTFSGTVVFSSALTTDTIAETTAAAGITLDGVLLKDGAITLATGPAVSSILDEDAMGSDSATAIPTQQSTKAYVDAQLIAANGLAGALAISSATGGTDIVVTAADKITVDVIAETTAASGVTVDGVLLKDGGVTLAAPLVGADNTVSKVNLLDYAEVTNAIGSTGGGTQSIDLTLGNSVTATVDTSANTFTFDNPTAGDELCGFTLVLTNGGSQTVTWPSSVDWPAATAPTLTAAGVDKLVFETSDGGTTWLGNLAGAAYA